MQAASLPDLLQARKVLGSNWIYLIDSGGQPHFHNLLPLFVKEVSAALYVFRLSDMLDDHPPVAYFKDGDQKHTSFPSPLSTADNFKYLVQAIHSHPGDCMLVCIGTHLDKIGECPEETLGDKNKRLNLLLPDTIAKKCSFFKPHNDLDRRQIIFPVDAKHFDSENTKSTAKKLRKAIELCPPQEINVPVWWYNFEIIVEKTSTELGRKVLSKAECINIASQLKFHEDALTEALKFFHKHHIFHYYPDALPDLVFCTTQVLLDKVTELVERAAYLRGESGDSDDSDSDPVRGTELQLVDGGIITLEFLAKLEKHYFEGLFGPAELIKILDHLLIATPFEYIGKLEYLIESVWKPITLGDLQKIVTDTICSLGEKMPNKSPSQNALTTLKHNVRMSSQPATSQLTDENFQFQESVELNLDIDSLLMMVASGKLEFFMPTLLGILSEADIESLRQSLLTKGTPLVIQFEHGWPPCGIIFCCLQVYLLKHGWTLGETLIKPKQNCVTLDHKDRACSVTLIGCLTCIEVYVQDGIPARHNEMCLLVRNDILLGFRSACQALNYEENEINCGFLCPYNHLADYLEKDKCLRCSQCAREGKHKFHQLEDNHKAWLPNTDQSAGLQVQPVSHLAWNHWRLNELRDQQVNGEGTLVAVLDTGASTQHISLSGQSKIFDRKSFVTGQEQVLFDQDPDSHGTSVAGVISGLHLPVQVLSMPDPFQLADKVPLGVAPNSSLVIFRVANKSKEPYDTEAVVKSLECIHQHNEGESNEERKIRIVIMPFRLDSSDQRIKKLIDFLQLNGVVCIAAAGNDGLNRSPGYPALYNSVLSVGSVNSFGHLSHFSTYHSSVDVLALGEDVLVPVNYPSTSQVTLKSGTSFAAPAVAGLVALLLQCSRKYSMDGTAQRHITDLDVLKRLFDNFMVLRTAQGKFLQPEKVIKFFNMHAHNLDEVVGELLSPQ